MNIAIVTGASSGMGREFVTQLSQYVQVDEIWVIARRNAALASLQEEVSVAIRPVVLDLCEAESFPVLEHLLAQEKPNVRLLVNAAGFGKLGAYHKIPVEEEAKMIDLNCKALVLMTRLALPYMGQNSHILQLDSLSAFQPVPFISTYAATKAFVLSYSRAMNRELKSRGIRMMAMSPGWVKTDFFNRAIGTNTDNELQHYSHLWDAKDVVATGLKDLYRTKKDYSVHGFSTRMQVRLVKLLPHSVIMNIWLKQQKTPKNNRNLTTKERE